MRKALKAARAEVATHFTPKLLDAAQRALANPRAKLNSKWVQKTHEAMQTAVAEFEAASAGRVSVEKQAALARVAIAAKKLRFAAAEALVAAKLDE